MWKFTAVGDMPAEEGFSAVIGAALSGAVALTLIFLVLFIMNKVHDKNDNEINENKEENIEDNKQEEEEK